MNIKKIYIPEQTGHFVIAAEIFASLYRKVTSRTLEITSRRDETCDLVVLGGDHENRFAHDCTVAKRIPPYRLRIGTDDYEIRSAKDGERTLLFIAGGTVRSLLYGVYRFFELAADCRYFWDGDIVPVRDELSFEPWAVYESPRFEYRGMRYFAHRGLHRFQAEHWDFEDWKKEIDYLLKKRFNTFMLRIGLDDLFQKAFPAEVPYPQGFDIEGSTERSYDDHTLFMPLEERGVLRKKILSYARERGLLHPEDVGTMTHWYSRTPMEFIRSFKPSYLPQANGGYYSDPTGQVWDIREDENMERYYALTLTHIREYGSPELFHTIGLSERHCYSDHEANHQMKLYTYRRIIARLRHDFPNAPLLLASWEFLDWSLEEVRDLLRTLDPEKTIVLDYIADIQDEHNCFVNWEVEGKRKWIFGIFHSNENNTEIRGNYPLIEDRLRRAAADPMCKGMVIWAESSHADTLMMEYVAANSWNPAHIGIDDFVREFCSSRYPGREEEMLTLWRMALPSVKKRIRYGFKNLDSSALYYFVRPLSLSPQLDRIFSGRYYNTLGQLLPVLGEQEAFFRRLAELAERAKNSDFIRRDLLDLAKSVAVSVLDTGFAAINTAMENWRCGSENATELKKALGDFIAALEALVPVLSASDELSLYRSLLRLKQGEGKRNPDFENTLKGNAENTYSRSLIPEIILGSIIPEVCCFFRHVAETLDKGVRKCWTIPEELLAENRKYQDIFYETPLETYAPNVEFARRELPKSLRHFGKCGEILLDFARREYEVARKGVFEEPIQ